MPWAQNQRIQSKPRILNIHQHQTDVPSGEHTKSYGKIHHFFMGKSTIKGHFSIAMLVHQRVKIWDEMGSCHILLALGLHKTEPNSYSQS